MINFKTTKWYLAKHRLRAARALERQLEYQKKKALEIAGNEKSAIISMMKRTAKVRQMLCEIHPFSESESVLEVGSGAHGLIFNFGNNFCVGVDPLAHNYQKLFPLWQKNAYTIVAIGERLPFADSSFDIVLSDNVIDHAEKPVVIVKELVRVLKPGGLFYLTVNVHHPLYSLASDIHGLWNAVGVNLELTPFADHTFHYAAIDIKRILDSLPLEILKNSESRLDSSSETRMSNLSGISKGLKKIFFKNAFFEIVALKHRG